MAPFEATSTGTETKPNQLTSNFRSLFYERSNLPRLKSLSAALYRLSTINSQIRLHPHLVPGRGGRERCSMGAKVNTPVPVPSVQGLHRRALMRAPGSRIPTAFGAIHYFALPATLTFQNGVWQDEMWRIWTQLHMSIQCVNTTPFCPGTQALYVWAPSINSALGSVQSVQTRWLSTVPRTNVNTHFFQFPR